MTLVPRDRFPPCHPQDDDPGGLRSTLGAPSPPASHGVLCASRPYPVLYITSEMSVKGFTPCNFFCPPPPSPTFFPNLLIVLKLSEFVTVTFREYCTKEKIALNKNDEISLIPLLPLPRGSLSAAGFSSARSRVNICHEYSFGELAALHRSLTYLKF